LARFAQETHTASWQTRGVRDETLPTATKRHAPLPEIAARQHGLLKTRQLGLTSGGIAKRVRNGSLHRHYRGVYSLGHRKLSREGELLAAVFAAGDAAALAALTAAVHWEVSRFVTAEIHVIAPTTRRPQAGFYLHSSRNLDPRDITTFNGIPVTTVARTLIDLTDRQREHAQQARGPLRQARARRGATRADHQHALRLQTEGLLRPTSDDRLQDAALSAQGLRVVRFREEDLNREPAAVIAGLDRVAACRD
jgi:predicted transcriptional regulator of viral defense system